MSSTSLTQSQLQQVAAVQVANPSNPAATWAALSLMGDQYAKAALQGLTDPSSFYAQVIANSNLNAGVSGSQLLAIENSVAAGYVNLLNNNAINPNPDGSIDLPNTTQIEKNYYNALIANGAPPIAAIDLSYAVLAENGLAFQGNWYTPVGGIGLNLDPARWGPPSDVLSNISITDAVQQFTETMVRVSIEGVGSVFLPAPLNSSEPAMLEALKIIQNAASNLTTGSNLNFQGSDGQVITVSTTNGLPFTQDSQIAISATDATGKSTTTVYDLANTQPWSSLTTVTLDGKIISQQEIFDSLNQQLKEFDTQNTHPYTELDIDEDPTGKVVNAQVTLDQKIVSAGGSIGEIFGSAIGKAIAGNNQFAKLAAGTVVGAIGQTFGQVVSNSLSADLSQVSVDQVFSNLGVNLAGAAAGTVASFLTAEIGTALGLHGYGAQLFNAAVGGFAGSVLQTVVTSNLGLGALSIGATWDSALSASEASVGGALGSILGQQIVHAENQAGAIGGQLLGAIGSAIGISLTIGEGLGFVLDTIIPGIGSLIGTILGTVIGDLFGGSPRHPSAIYTIDPGSYLYTANFNAVSASDGGDPGIPQAMAGGVVGIVNAYLTAVGGVALASSKQLQIGYKAANPSNQFRFERRDRRKLSGIPFRARTGRGNLRGFPASPKRVTSMQAKYA